MATYKYCEKCNKKFEVEHRGQRYCSNECQKGISLHRRKYKCKKCGKYYKPTPRRTSYFCSWECVLEDTKGHSRFVILERDNFTCIYCGRSSYEDNAELHLDHIVPYSKGGKGIASNLATSCKRCNSEKGNRLLTNEKLILKEVKKRNIKRNIYETLKINNTR